MDGFVFIILAFLIFVGVMLSFALSAKGKKRVYLLAVTATLAAWFVGLLLDANISEGFLALRILLPVLAMGFCILSAVMKDKND